MVRLQSTMNAYVKWLTQRDNLSGEKGVPAAVVARTMIAHGEDFDRDSQFGNCLIEMGRANEQVANIQEQYANDATRYWLDSVERSVAMMKEYQVRQHYPSPLFFSFFFFGFPAPLHRRVTPRLSLSRYDPRINLQAITRALTDSCFPGRAQEA